MKFRAGPNDIIIQKVSVPGYEVGEFLITGRVVSVGPHRHPETGAAMVAPVKEGQYVIVFEPVEKTTDIKHNGEEYMVLETDSVMAILDQSSRKSVRG